MLPVFKPGELVLVTREKRHGENTGYLGVGDCAVYTYEGRTLLHRVVKAGPDGVWFADDAGRIAPHLVGWELVRGRALSSHPLAAGGLGFFYSKFRRSLYKILNARELAGG